MSLYSALFSGVSGLSAESTAMASVADNITNINTVGYKATETQFSTLVGDGRAGGRYVAGGVTAAPKSLVANQGLLQTSANPTDLGIAGQGFFVTRAGIDEDSAVSLTRAGSFAPDKEGFLKNSAGLYLQGWRLNAQGEYLNTGSVDALEPVRVSDLTGTAAPTTKVAMRANFQSTSPTYTGAYAPGNMATYSANPTATGAVKPTFTRPMDIFDAQGGSHRVTLSVLKTGPNTWQGELYAQPASDVTQANGLLASGTITFDGNGRLALTAANPTATPPVVPFPATIQPGWTNGANAQPIKLEFGTAGSQDGFSQSEDDSSVLTSSINGGLLGNVASISVSKTGEVSAVFDDGSQRAVFQLPIATVPNPNGLTRSTGNGYTISDLSGAYAINAPGSLGAGEISSYTLEASTADLAREFTNMILFQRAYSASSKIITTVDDMLQEVSNLKR